MTERSFSHLHLHTQFSLLDGAVKPGKLFSRCKELGMDSVAMTDHGNLYGAIDFYRGAKKEGIKPILGLEAYYTPTHRTDKSGKSQENNYHLILLAENNQGYKNLLKLSSLAFTEGFYYRPRIDTELLKEYREGLIGTTACVGGIVPQMIMQQRENEARQALEQYAEIFGENNFFVEIQDHQYVDPLPIDPNPMLIELANKMGLGIIVTNDVHFLNEEDYESHDVLTCLSTGKMYADQSRMKYPKDVYLKSAEQMRSIFPDLPQASDLTLEIANRCNVELDLESRHAPSFTPPDNLTPGEFLRKLVYEGAHKLYPEVTEEVKARIEREIEVIDGKGFSSYFLIVWDFCNWAAQRGIPTGARGSGVGTIVGYCLGLCNIDPIRYGLLFERFMDPERDEMPDIDIDICQDGRPLLLEYVREKYGHIAQIITFGTLKARSVIRDVCRVLDVPLPEADRLAKMVPEGPKVTLESSLEEVAEFRDEYQNSPVAKKVIDIGKRLQGLTRHSGVHACAVVIADDPLSNFLPICRQTNSEDLITQFEGPNVEAVGLLKMDFLGLRTLSVIQKTIEWVKQLHDVDIDIENIDITDQKVFNDIFGSGRTKGIFQFESGGMVDMLMKLKPDRLEDLIAANALYRPGPMELIPDFIARKHGAKWEVAHPIMREILEETFGIMVYQEQVMQICHRLGGIKLRAAYTLIKAIGKKNDKIINAAFEEFVKGCTEKGLSAKQAEEIFGLIKKFAGYGFNKSHATRYSYVAYQTAYLKAYWPAEFMAAVLTYEKGETKKVVQYIGECKNMGIEILPPDVNESFTDFTVIYKDQKAKKKRAGDIRFGLGAVKSVGDKAVQFIIEARKEVGAFKSLYHFCENVDLRAVNRSVIESLIKAGAFDRLGGLRSQMVEGLEDAIKAGLSAQNDRNRGQKNLFAGFEDESQDQTESDAARLPDVPAWPEMTLLKYEKDVLGLYVTRNPLSKYAEAITAYSTAHTHELANIGGREVILGGMITKERIILTKKGKNAGAKMAVLEVEDFYGKCEVVLFPKKYAANAAMIETDKIVFIRGKIDASKEMPQILCDEVIDIAFADEKLKTKVRLIFDADNIAQDTAHKIAEVCGEHKGSSPVYLIIRIDENRSVSAVAAGNLAVCPDIEFREKVRALIGKANFEMTR